jgi:chemotaxis methyl-accepting protein methylase
MSSVASHNNDNFETLLLTLQNTLGVIVPEQQRADILERIEPLLSTYDLDSTAALAEKMETNQSDELKSALLDAISKSQSSWQLGSEIKTLLHDYVFNQLPEHAKVWIVGCEQGQFAYSIAMELAKYEHENEQDKKVQLIASDISAENIDIASRGTYSKQQLSDLDEDNMKLFVSINNGAGEIKQKIRQLIDFRQCDLTCDMQSLGDMDLIICPSVLVYFSNDIKAGVIKQFADLLKPGGIFMTDNSQSMMGTGNILERVEHPAGLFFRKVA